MRVSQAHKLRDSIHDIDLRAMDSKTVGEVRLLSAAALSLI